MFPTISPRIISVPQGSVAVRTIGTGPDLLFIHGWPTNSTTWHGVVAQLKDHYTCHLVDLPGSGVAELNDQKLGFHDHADAVERALDALELDTVVLVGHDSGGAIARFVAVNRPHQVVGLVLGGTEIPHTRPQLLYRLKVMSWLPGANLIFRLMMGVGWIRRSQLMGFGTAFADPTWADGPFREEALAPLLASSERTDNCLAFLRQFDLQVMDTLAGVHQQLTCPVLLVWGDNDTLFPLDNVRAMMTQFGGQVALKTIPRARLFAHEDFAADYVTHAIRWLDRNHRQRDLAH